MTDTTVTERETRRANELKPGDVIAPAELGDAPADVLYVEPYIDEAAVAKVLLVHRAIGDSKPITDRVPAYLPFDLATEAELDEIRRQGRRAQRITDLRQFVEFLSRNPWAPLPYLHMQADMHRSEIGGDIDADGLAELHRIADALGEKVDEHLDDRTSTGRQFGSVEYKVIGWHKAGRPLVISDETIEQAGRMGSWNEREQRWDDPTPTQLATVADKLRADQAAEPTCQGAPAGFEADCGTAGPHGPHGPEPVGEEPKCTPACDAQMTDPATATGLARSWHSDDCPVAVHHLMTADGVTACGKAPSELPPAHGYLSFWNEDGGVDCPACVEKAPF
jgi:hypothetical protein